MKTRCKKCRRKAPLVKKLCRTCAVVAEVYKREELRQEAVLWQKGWLPRGGM